MGVVLDTNVLAYALLGVAEYREDATRAIQCADEIWAPDILRAELANVLWQWLRSSHVPLETGLEILIDAEALVGQFVPTDVLWEDALALALDRDHPVYDTLFVALALVRGSMVLTYDRRLRDVFPEHVVTVPEFLNAAP